MRPVRGDLLAALASDFAGHEPVRQRLINKTPKYGNDDDYADEIMREVFENHYRAHGASGVLLGATPETGGTVIASMASGVCGF